MTNIEKYNNIFSQVLDLKEDSELLKINREWDSITHMTLVIQLENEFNLRMDHEDIMEFSSYNKGLEILSFKYNILFSNYQ